MVKKNSILRGVCLMAVFCLVFCLCGCSLVDQRYLQEIDRLKSENAALSAQVDSLTAQLEAMRSSILDHWELTAEAGDNLESPAKIHFSAVPAIYQPSQRADLIITLNGAEKATVPCVWDGAAYTAFLTLEPEDGYGYYCILTGSNGKEERTELTSVENPQLPILTYLASNMSSYCNLIVDDWSATEKHLTLVSGSGNIQLPLLYNGDKPLECTSAQLVLQKNGKDVAKKDLILEKGETENSYYTDVSGIRFKLPEMEAEDQLDLWLDVYLSEGGGMTSSGGSWYKSGGALDLVVG